MATNAWAASYNHDTDANFRIWGDDLSTKWQALGLVQTADTGQINWTTVARPATNVYAGYEIYYLNDSLHASAPIYIKVEFGTGSAATRPALRITMGTGSNGSGTITNPTSIVSTAGAAGANGGTFSGTSYNFYACFNQGIFWFCGGFGGANTGLANLGFCIARTCNSTGTPDNIGAILIYLENATSNTVSGGYQLSRFSPTFSLKTVFAGEPVITYPANSADATQLTNGNYAAINAYFAYPQVKLITGICGVARAALAEGSTTAFELFPGTSQTFIAIGSEMTNAVVPREGATSTLFQTLLLWQ